ncbi:MAG TPA: NAD(P)-dependent oxidoreductase [Actinomycetota bacterium]|nr:NAD(P)-dependent oxidoreductase [Actinomycetota bacterium]
MARILVVDPLLVSEGFGIGPGWAGPEHEVVVPAGYGSEDLRSELPRAEALLTAHAPVTEAMLELAPALRLVAKPGAGVDNIDVPAATRRGVLVTNVPGARGRAVAEHALFLVLSLARRAWMRDDAAWRDALAVQLGGKTLGIVGLGDIGAHLARFGHGLGMTVVAHTRSPDPDRLPDVPVRFVGAEELLREADVVVLCVPLSERTRGLIDRAALASMKEDALLVNVARGPVIVTDDLVEAMRGGHLGGAGLDVADPEPLPPDHPLRAIPNVLLSPHNAGRTIESQREALERMRANVRSVLAGDEPLDPVGP